MPVEIIVALIGLAGVVLAEVLRRRLSKSGTQEGSSTEAKGKGPVTVVQDSRDTSIVVGAPTPDDATRVEIVSVRFERSEADPFPRLDIMLRNLSDTACVLHEAVFENISVWEFPAPMFPHAMPVSWEYEVDLGGGQTQTIRLSQEIEPRRADRFQTRLGTSKPLYPFSGHFLYLFDITLVANRDRVEIGLGTFLASLPQPMQVDASYSPGLTPELRDELVARARQLSQRVRDGAEVDPQASAALDELLGLESIDFDKVRSTEDDSES